MRTRPKEPDEEWGEALDATDGPAEDLLEILAKVRVFDMLTGEELRQVERIVHRRVYLPQEVVVRQGAPGVGMYIIQSGSARVFLEAGNGETIQLAALSDGNFFGEMSLLDGAPRAASVAAVERSHIIGFFQADLMDLINQSPRMGLKIVLRISQLMNERLHETLQEYRLVQRMLRRLRAAARSPEGVSR